MGSHIRVVHGDFSVIIVSHEPFLRFHHYKGGNDQGADIFLDIGMLEGDIRLYCPNYSHLC